MWAFCRTSSWSVFSLIWNINEVSGWQAHPHTSVLKNNTNLKTSLTRWDVLPIITIDYSLRWRWYPPPFTDTEVKMITIFPGATPARVARRWIAKAIRSLSSQSFSECTFNTIYSVFTEIFKLTGQSCGYNMGYKRHLFFVKRGILIGWYSGPQTFFFFFFGGGGHV